MDEIDLVGAGFRGVEPGREPVAAGERDAADGGGGLGKRGEIALVVAEEDGVGRGDVEAEGEAAVGRRERHADGVDAGEEGLDRVGEIRSSVTKREVGTKPF